MTAAFSLHESERARLEELEDEYETVGELLDKLDIRIMSYDGGSDDPDERREWELLDERIDKLTAERNRLGRAIDEQAKIVAALDAQWGAP